MIRWIRHPTTELGAPGSNSGMKKAFRSVFPLEDESGDVWTILGSPSLEIGLIPYFVVRENNQALKLSPNYTHL